jgi:hypothetical protein
MFAVKKQLMLRSMGVELLSPTNRHASDFGGVQDLNDHTGIRWPLGEHYRFASWQ